MKTYLKARLLIDGTGADPIENPVLVMEGDRITEVGPSSRIEIPSGAAVIDRGDEVLIPGLIDSHCHAGEDSKRGESVREQHTKR